LIFTRIEKDIDDIGTILKFTKTRYRYPGTRKIDKEILFLTRLRIFQIFKKILILQKIEHGIEVRFLTRNWLNPKYVFLNVDKLEKFF